MTTEHPSQDNLLNEQDWERTLDLFKIEYEQAAQRYENIYKAIWQIFQYMALLSAGILTFGYKATFFPPEIILFISLIPLACWFLAIYIPMNRYGKTTREHLEEIEGKLNDQFSQKYWSITHYTNFYKAKPWWQVSQAVNFLGFLLLATLVFLFFNKFFQWIDFSPQLSPEKNQFEEINKNLDILSKDIYSLIQKVEAKQ